MVSETGWLENTQPSRSTMSGSGGVGVVRDDLAQVGERGGERPTGVEVRVHAPEHGNARVRAAEYLRELHRRDGEREGAVELEVARVGAHGRHLGRALREFGEQLGVEVKGDELVAPRGQVGGHAAGAGAQVQDRAVRRLGELAPQEQVGVVGAVLHVVPGHRGGRHSDHRFARPRSASRSRSSSSAV